MTGLADLLPDLRRAGTTAGGEYCCPCPWCGGTDRFRVWPAHPSGGERWWCRRCNRQGDTIDLLRERDGLSYSQAAAFTGLKVSNCQPVVLPRRCQAKPLCPPCAIWRSRAAEVAQTAENALWTPVGERALSYLHGRGFHDGTVRAARLGFNSSDVRESPQTWGLPTDRKQVWIPRGIVIPWRLAGSLWRLNVRRPTGTPKYIGPAGSSNGLYGSDGIRPDCPVVLVEGEFDALAITQEAGDLVAAVATGSTHGARHPRWQSRLAHASTVLVAYDDDEAGDTAAQWWLSVLPGARRCRPTSHDVCEMLQDGGGVRSWVKARTCASVAVRQRR
jgi:DNA primase